MKEKTKLNIATRRRCTGCMACADSCYYNALSITIGDDGHYYPVWDISKCVGCNLCEKVCPVVSNREYGAMTMNSKPYAAWALDDKLILKSASGGVFAAVATYVLKRGGYVVGAVSAGRIVKHIVIDRVEDLDLLQGSKYLQSDMRGVYRQIKKLLDNKQMVLFSGTGCQVGGLLSFLGRKYNNLFTVDLVCAGVPSNFIMSRFCDEEGVEPQSIRWRDKENGWKHGLQLTITGDKKEYKYKTEDCFFWGAFLGGLTHRYACYNCRFCGTDRLSDLTIADYWRIKEFKEQHYKGVSILIVHSQNGEEVIRKSDLERHPTMWTSCVKNNPRIVCGKRMGRWMLFERNLLSCAISHFDYSTLRRVYAGKIWRKDWLWLPYKMFKYVRWRIMSYLTNNHISKILKKL